VQFCKNTFPITTLSPVIGVCPFVAEPEFPILTSPVASIQTHFPLNESVPVAVTVPAFGQNSKLLLPTEVSIKTPPTCLIVP
jgi:hypothetical protein